jgi:uncharacterized protein involved in exopolysaccharide biosynthesis
MQTEEREIELIDYIEVMLRRKWLIALGTLACVAGAVVYLLATASAVPLYTASAQIYIVPAQSQSKGLTDTQVEIPTLTPEFYESVAVSDELVLAMNKLQQGWIDSLGLKVPGELSLETKVTGSTRLEMRVSTADTLFTRLILYAWVDTFMARTRQLSATESERYYEYVVAQHETARKNLEAAEDTLLQFSLANPITSLQNQQQTYLNQLRSAQDTLILTQIRLEQQTTQLRRARELVQALEVDGEPLYLLPAEKLQTLRPRLSSELAQQLVDKTLELQNFKDRQNQEEERYNLLLLSFDQEHEYSRLQRAAEELADLSESFQRSYLQARNKELTAGTNLKALEEEIKKHPVSFGVSGSQAGELNPAYVALEQKRAEEGLSYETARLYVEKGDRELKDLEARLEETQRQLFSVQAERQQLVDGKEKVRRNLKMQIASVQASLDTMVKSYLENKKVIGELETQVLSLRNRMTDQQDQLTSLNERVQEVQDALSRALTDSVRLGREKGIYAATFERFAQLSEEARIAQQKANTNLRIITRDVTAKPVSAEEDSRKKVWISGAVGLLLSTLAAFLLEYVHKARARRAGSF